MPCSRFHLLQVCQLLLQLRCQSAIGAGWTRLAGQWLGLLLLLLLQAQGFSRLLLLQLLLLVLPVCF